MAENPRYVHVRCTFRSGAFPTEYLVIIEADNQGHAGFVPREYIDVIDGESAMIEGRVLEWNENGPVTIQFPGSFFVASRGIVSFPREWADANVVSADLTEETA